MKRNKNFKERFIDLLTKFLFLFAIAMLIVKYLFPFFGIMEFCRVSGDSMFPTLKDKEVIISSRIGMELERGDIVIVEHDGVYVIKRIIGLPGDRIKVKDNLVYIDDQLYKEEYIYAEQNIYDDVEIKLNDDEYFILGDNRGVSIDSRQYGSININDIVGEVKLVLK